LVDLNYPEVTVSVKNSSEVLIRPAYVADLADIARLFRTTRRHSLAYLPELHTPEEDLEFFSNKVYRNNRVYVAILDETIVGFIAFSDDFIEHLYLLPEAQGSGVGARLLDVAKQNAAFLQLWTFQRNQRARRFYAKHGFVEIEETDGTDNEEKEPDVLFEWRRSS
jgi:GNAT superfamily N-acetyltransferase